ncbi:hypothetical protein [Nocardioides sp. InS609-2]|uniref:hypothetical protein n=1 Tax=Nocardioides sp. InS609-2 TaxID=2760705 RepID=UPI0020BFD365|nr:hypothetical protein [Nocardioides sp. InS609-2]
MARKTTFASKADSFTDKLVDDVRAAVEISISRGLVLPALLRGVEVKRYRGADGSLHASILVDQFEWSEVEMPLDGGRPPLTDTSTGRYWYSPSARSGEQDEELEQILRDEIADVLLSLATVNLRKVVVEAVAAL